MIEFNNHPFTFFFIANSFILILLILNQNESPKDSTSLQKSGSISNPFEIFTWLCFIFQFFLLLLKTKLSFF